MLFCIFYFISFVLGKDDSNNTKNTSKLNHINKMKIDDRKIKNKNPIRKTNIPLRRLNAMNNIPKYVKENADLANFSKKIHENKKDLNKQNQTHNIPPNPDYQNEDSFKDDPSDPFDEKEDTETNSIETNINQKNSNENNKNSIKQNQSKNIPPNPNYQNEDSFKDDSFDEKQDIKTNSIEANIKQKNSNNENKKMAKFQIVSVLPRTVYTHGDEKIEIKMNTTLNGPPFIMFRGINKIVHGRHSKKDLTVKCRTPKLPEGEIEIVVSIDKIKWSEPYTLIVITDDGNLSWLFVICASVAFVAVMIMISRLICGKRMVPKKKANKIRNEDIINFMRPSSNTGNLHKRTRISSEV